MSIIDPSTTISKLAIVIEKAASDPAYRKALATSTKATLESAGISIPDGLEVKLVENSDEVRNLIRYARSSLSSETLQQIKSLAANAESPKTALESYAKLQIDAWLDPTLEKQLEADAKATLSKYGISLPASVTVEQLEADASVAYLPLASDPGIASTITSSLSNLGKLITAGSYLAGLGFAIASSFKFKQHKDNPTQIPVGTPIALVFIAAALLFLPSLATNLSSS